MALAKSFTLLLLIALVMPACSRFSDTNRQQRAYAKYVRKQSAARQQQRAKVQRTQQEIPAAEPRTDVTTSVDE